MTQDTSPKEPPKSDATPPDKPEVTPPKVTDVPKDAVKLQRDFTGFSDEEANFLRQMSNDAYNYVSKSLRELKELKNKTQEVLYQHPEAYVLHPEFKSALSESQMYSFVANHWREQLARVKRKEPWISLKGFDDNGQPIYSEEFEPTEDAEIDIQAAYNTARDLADKARQKIHELKSSFTSRVKTDIDAIQAERAKRFEWVADPKKLDTVINIPGIGGVPIKQIITDFKGLFPAHFHSDPILDVAADLFVSLQILASKLNAKSGEPSVEGAPSTASKKEDVLSAEGIEL